MRESLQRICDSFIENREIVHRAFRFDYSSLYPVCANIFTSRGQTADPERIEACKRLLKERTGIFSYFRGNIRPPILCMLASRDDPSALLDETLTCYDLLKEHFFSSNYLALVSFLMADISEPSDAAGKAARGRALYKRMRKEHPFLTSSEDSVFAVLLAFSEQSDDVLIDKMETSYDLLRKRFISGNALQAASHVLTLAGGLPADNVDRLISLYDGIRAAGGKFDRNELAILAAVSMLDADLTVLQQDMLDVDAFLAQQKGYGLLGPGRARRMAHAAMIVSDEYTPRESVDAASLTSTLAMIAAQEAAMSAVIISSTSSASSSSHSN